MQTTPDPMSPTSVALPASLRRRLDVAAQKLQRKRADVMRLAIAAYLDQLDVEDPEGEEGNGHASAHGRRGNPRR
jgi:predicted transcriptional regulator